MPSILKGTPTNGAILRHLLDKRLAATSVALPGTVVSYDADARTCAVRPGVHRLVPSIANDDIDVVEELPALQDVPVCWPAGRGFAFADVSLSAGDPVLLIAMDRDMAAWRRTGEPAEPEDARQHHWGSCVAIPGLAPRTNPIPQPNDAAALGSLADKLIAVLKTAAGSAVVGVLNAAFPNVAASTDPYLGTTTGSDVIKLAS